MAKWTITAKGADFGAIASHFGIDPVVARVIRNRDLITNEEIDMFLNGTENDEHDPKLLNDLELAVGYIKENIDHGKKIRVIGDYDVDGVTATAILVKGITAFGGRVDYRLPNRITDGYGINERLVRDAIEDRVDCIITCDNGIAASEVLELAESNGIMCILTDHHEVPYTDVNGEREYIIPRVHAVIDPKRPDNTYPYPNICGAMVAYKLIQELLEGTAQRDILQELTELAALGTVCDVMELRDENRVLVKRALSLMCNSSNIGLRTLFTVTGCENKPIKAGTLGFIAGPCINAAGRLEDASEPVELLLTEDEGKAVKIATELKNLNDLRKEMTEKGVSRAIEIIEEDKIYNRTVMIIYIPGLHESLAGIVAGRIRERYYHPVIVLTDSDDMIKGSGRSIEAYDMFGELNKVKDLFTHFGGHKMAAGMSLDKNKLYELERRLNENPPIGMDECEERIRIDVVMPLEYVSQKLIDDISLLEPFGTGNPKPVFAERNLQFLHGRRMGALGNMARFRVRTERNGEFDIVRFRNLDILLDYIRDKFGDKAVEDLFGAGYRETSPVRLNVIYTPEINEYRGQKNISFIMNDYC
ncbi:MAG: single-stranded-DNA-specific exonuclease RecJ [Lachnospiraceae bacterium]|nr:single-stranded-DNA-specific exonuclease RecJ [Lachnospiraceae bacterium]